jgi:hypothetical protein
MAAFQFNNTLTLLLKFGWPALKALTCLEANECNTGDISLYWHAILAEIDSVIKSCTMENDFPKDVAQQIYGILHRRHEELFNKDGNGRISTVRDLFYAGLYLDPGKHTIIFICDSERVVLR